MKTLILGYSGVGKTSYLLKIAQNEAFAGNRVRMVTGETYNYINNLIPRHPNKRSVKMLDNLEIDTTVKSFAPSVTDFMFVNSLCIDGIQNWIDVFDENKAFNFLNPLLRLEGLNVYMTSVLKAAPENTGNLTELFGSHYLPSVCDKVIWLDGSVEESLRVNILKDKYAMPRSYPVVF